MLSKRALGLAVGLAVLPQKACTPMAVPDQLLAMMDAVATAKISHEGSAL